jgi:toxin ParE1/3/4
MSRFRLAAQAKIDLSEIWDYIGIANQNPTAAQRQVETLYQKFAILATQPLMGQACYRLRRGLRMFSAGSYVIFYTPCDDGVEVERVVHGARDTGRLF